MMLFGGIYYYIDHITGKLACVDLSLTLHIRLGKQLLFYYVV